MTEPRPASSDRVGSSDPDPSDELVEAVEPEEDDFYRSVPLEELFGGRGEQEEAEAEEAGQGSVGDARVGPGVEDIALSLGFEEESVGLEEAPLASSPAPGSLASWVALYYRECAADAPSKTEAAKRRDLERFLNFYLDELGHDHVEGWVAELTLRFQERLSVTRSPHTGRLLSPATVNRVLATLRHFSRWLARRRPLPSGDPFRFVSSLPVKGSGVRRGWRSLEGAAAKRLWCRCLERVESCRRGDQSPLLEAAVFQCLQGTGLRPHQLVALDLADYHSKGFHGVFRRGRKVVTKIWVPAETRRWLERYLDEVRGRREGPLFLSRTGERLRSKGVARILKRLG